MSVQEQYLTERDVAQRLLEVANRLNNSGKVSDALYVNIGATTLTELLATVSQLLESIDKWEHAHHHHDCAACDVLKAALQPSEAAEPQKEAK